MKIKYSPVKWNPNAANLYPNSLPDTQISYVDENTLEIDNETYAFDPDSILFPNINKDTDEVIKDAYRDSEELFIIVRRFYSKLGSQIEWDDAEYHSIGS